MKAARFWILFIALTIWHSLAAQVQFSNRYSFNIPGDLFSNIIIQGDSIFLVGLSGDTANNSSQLNINKILTSVFTLNGTDARHSVFDGEAGKYYEAGNASLIKVTNNSFAICGGTLSGNNSKKSLFVIFDSLMNMTLLREYPYPDPVYVFAMQKMVLMRDGSIVMAGSMQDTFGIAGIVALKIDTSANLIWLKNYSPSTLSDIYPNIVSLSDTTLLIGCEHSNELLDAYSILSQTKFMIIDTAGNLIRQWMDSNDSTFAPYGLLKTIDGGYAYCGRYMIQMNGPYDDAVTAGVVTKLDSAFNLKWRKVYNDTGSCDIYVMFNQMRQLPDGSLIAAGAGVSWDTVSHNYTPTGWFVKLTADGDSVWSRMYRGTPGTVGDANTNVINDFQVLPDGGIIGCGEADDGGAIQYSQQAWLIRLDSMGCLIPGCDTLTPTGISPVANNGSHTGIVVYPNPANNMAYLLIKTDKPNPQLSFKIYNANGKLVTEEKGALPDVTYLLYVNTYATGTYFVQVLSEGQAVADSKFIKE